MRALASLPLHASQHRSWLRRARAFEFKLQTKGRKTMPSSEQILNKLLSTLRQRFAIDTEQVTKASRLSDIGIDSLHLVDIMLDMEHEFSFQSESLQLPPNPSLEQIALAILRGSETRG
jgi:acyl carrier protein